MPELPEVEIVKQGLNNNIVNFFVKKVILNRPNLRYNFPDNFAKILENQQITEVSRRSKYILIHLSNDYIWLIHLGMSGALIIIDESEYKAKKHDHALFYLQKDNKRKLLIYNDYRRFGFMDLCYKNKLKDNKFIKILGIEPLQDEFNTEFLYQLTRDKNTPIKNFLMNAKYIVGVGNIYASESLFLSSIKPTRITKNITKKEAEKLVKNIKQVLLNSIENKGSSLKDFINVNGKSGNFQNNFFVYNRENQDCLVCKKGVIKRIKQSNRSSFYCNNCQK